jgi:cytochrome c1
VIPGIHAANGLVGPPLYFFSRRTMIAGELPNTPDNLVRWIMNPPSVEPGTAMPDLGLSDQQARDAAAYLYTLH